MNKQPKKRRRPAPWRMWVLVLGLLFLPCVRGVADNTVTVDNAAAQRNGPAMVVSGIQVVIDGTLPEDRKNSYAYMARQLIRLHPGDVLHEKALQASIDALKLSNRFAAIHVDSTSQAGGETLIYTLTPYRTIAKIDIAGKSPLFEREILNQMTIYPGNPYTLEQLSSQTGAVARRYKREGYIDPKVSVTEQLLPGDEQAVILVDIDKGPHYVLGTLAFAGNTNVSATALKLRMSVWRADLMLWFGRFSEYQLKKDMTALKDYYYSKGFAEAELSYSLAHPGDSRQVDVTVQIKEGPRYSVEFSGNKQFWDMTLNKDVVIFTSGNRNNTGIRKSIRNIKKRYHEAGYLETTVKVDRCPGTETGEQTQPLCFAIEEGPQTIVDEVTIAGNEAVPEEQIKEQMLTRPPSILHDGAYVPETLETDTYAVTTMYLNSGFTKRTVDSRVKFNQDRTGAGVSLDIEEGPQTMVRSIVIKNLTGVPEAAARKVLVHHPGDPFRSAASEVEKEAIIGLISEKGYPYATVQTDTAYSADHTQADIVYTVDTGPRVTLGNIFVSGNLRTDEKVIRQELAMEPGGPLSLQALYEAQRRLRDMEIFHSVNYRTFGLKEKADTVDLFVEVEENKPYYVQGGTGYQSDTGFFGRIKGGDRNLFGLNKELWASAAVSETGYRLETQFTEPRFLGTRTAATAGVFAEELTEFNQTFGTRSIGGSLGVNRIWDKHLTTAISFGLERRTEFSVDAQPGEEFDEETRTDFVTTPSFTYDTRDSFVRPTRGLLSSMGVNVSKGVGNQLDDFVRYKFDTRYYWTPLKKLTLVSRAMVGQVVSYSDSAQIPDDQLFYLGGIQSVRGFAENLLRFDSNGDPVGGKTAVVGNLEARIDLGRNLELATFYDMGTVQDTLLDEGSSGFRSSVGLGLRYLTPIGPIGLVYGHNLNPEDGESSGRFHFSIGYSF
ncbi:outer membrane protein assembly factor BamA [Desulfopila sp. IMCC35006]|uniref:outer membrane protein assembly factor BamA n=1 Tax=Desulfopila sp. IMCC35006 TaxID=2569542 RepID=UPI0010ACD14B|nr:outer membrane protein assembly factor BamA [Desulfopila sp. IMCC35006]TKB25112.1 outer membrane protein assembly factor BamA [Desulfopila sp. IMCC35006]